MIKQEELDEMSLETLEAEIESREELIEQMVGWLYPGILLDEIKQLREQLEIRRV